MFYKTDPSLVIPPKPFSPVPMEILMTVILDKKSSLLKSLISTLIFDLKKKCPQYYSVCMLFDIWYSGSSSTHHIFLSQNHRTKTISFWNVLSPNRLPACFSSFGTFQEFWNETYFQNGPTWKQLKLTKEMQNKTTSGCWFLPTKTPLQMASPSYFNNFNPSPF